MLTAGWTLSWLLPARARALARTRLGEAAVLVPAWVLLLALSRGAPALEASTSPLLALPALLAALLCAWLGPGFLLWKLARGGRPTLWLLALPMSFALGLAWLLLPASLVLLARADLGALAALATGLTGALAVVYLARRRGTEKPWSPPVAGPAREERHVRAIGPALALALVVALAVMMAFSARAGFTRGSDEWVQLAASRYFLEARTFDNTWTFDAWSLLVALVVRLSGLDLLEASRLYLPPVLVLMAALSFLCLGWVLFRDAELVAVAFLLQALYCLTDMNARGDGAGMGFLVRILEDKYVACFVVVPLAQAAFLRFLGGGEGAWLTVGGALWLAAIALNPLALFWAGLPLGIVAAAAVARRRLPPRAASALGIVLLLGAAAGLAWWLRSLRPGSYFVLRDPAWSFNAALRGISQGKLLVLSPDEGWYMADPRLLLAHPFMLAAVIAAFVLLPCCLRSPGVLFLVASTLGPVLLIFNPWTATFLGRWITPWMLHRLLWMVPVALTLAYLLGELAGWLTRRTAAREPPAVLRHPVPAWLAALALLAALLDGRFERSSQAIAARQRVWPEAGERELVRALERDRPGGTVLAPPDLSIRLPAWSSRFRAFPGLAAMRFDDRPLLEACADFYAAAAVGERHAALLRARQIDYVVVEAGSAMESALGARPAAFRPVHRGADYVLYAWRPERWPGVSQAP